MHQQNWGFCGRQVAISQFCIWTAYRAFYYIKFCFMFCLHSESCFSFHSLHILRSTLKTCRLVSLNLLLLLCRYSLYYITSIRPVFGFRFHHGQTICSTNNNNKWWHRQLNNITSLWQTTNQLIWKAVDIFSAKSLCWVTATKLLHLSEATFSIQMFPSILFLCLTFTKHHIITS